VADHTAERFPCWACGQVDCADLPCGLDRCLYCHVQADEAILAGHHLGCPNRVPDEGETVLDAVHATVTNYVVWPDEHSSVAYTLWIAATHAQTVWEHATRFVLKSPIKRCGKTRAQEIGRELAHEPLSSTNISVAALVHSVSEADPPTLVIDEADSIFGRKRDRPESAEDLRGVLNSGHSRGWPYVRWDPKSRQRDECATFAMALIGGIGDLPDTIEDRAVVVSMRRRAPGEPIKQFRRRRVIPGLHELRSILSEWVSACTAKLSETEPELPVEDRQADVWEPLVAIADAAGGHWPKMARKACRHFCGATGMDEGTLGERLLADLADIWSDDEEHLFTTTILERLKKIGEAPWRDGWDRNPKPLTDRGLARLLKPYGVASKNVRIDDEQAKGYGCEDLADPWRRYVPSVPPSHDDEKDGLTSENGWDGSGTDADFGSVPGSDQGKQADWDAGTDGTVERLNGDHGDTPEAVADWEQATLAGLDPDAPDYWDRFHQTRAEAVRRRKATP
jgi:hypothetical protein